MVNSSSPQDLPFEFCSNHKFSHVDDTVTILTCVMVGLSTPVAVAGNSLILAAIWRNPVLRTPCYVFLCGLALTDLCTGIFGQPSYVLYRVAELKVYKNLYCVMFAIAHSTVPYFVVLTGLIMTAMTVERWLHMSRRSLITVRRVYIIEVVLTIIPVPYMGVRRLSGVEPYFDTNVPFVAIIEGTLAICYFAVSSLAYFKVFRIISHHQRRVHATAHSYGKGQAVINLEKYKKSVRTILWAWALFLLCYSPFALSAVLVQALNVSHETSLTILHLATTILLMSSSLNPFLYIWRLRDIRAAVKTALTANILR